ncbi:MAG: hypothetical protein P8X74_02690 [Reinekea sp.]|jgi:hypothetical protein
MIKRHHLMAIFVFLAGALFATADVAADTIRRCDGEYRWQTTGGSYHGEFGKLTAYGKKSTSKNARKAARGALMDCFQAQWDKRWDREVPDRCKIGAKVETYDLDTLCERRTDGHNASAGYVCDSSGHSSNRKTIVDVRNGDIKTALEVQVCCMYRNGVATFNPENSVFVRLSGHSWSNNTHHSFQQECNGKRLLSNNYEIDCTRVRDTICKRP